MSCDTWESSSSRASLTVYDERSPAGEPVFSIEAEGQFTIVDLNAVATWLAAHVERKVFALVEDALDEPATNEPER